MMYGDGRRMPPRNARGEFMSRGRGRGRRSRRGDRGMDYPRDMRYDYGMDGRGDMRHMDNRNYDYPHHEMNRNVPHDMRMGDGHYMQGGRHGGYEPVEFMGYCTGYYGSPDDYRRDYGYRDYSYGRRDYGYDYGDYGETLSEEEIEKWAHKLMSQLDEREKQMFHKDTIMQKARSMGKQMEGFGEKELWVATLMVYTDYKHSIGQNPDLAIKLAYDWLSDKDVAVKGAEKLCVYYDCIVEGEDD